MSYRGSFWGDEKGAAAPLFALSLIALVAAGGLAWDVSRGYALRGELDAAADAAALAGATQLDGKTGAQARALAAAQGGLVKNSQRLANTAETNVAASGQVSITFLSSLSPRTTATGDANSNFIQVDVNPRQLSFVYGAIVGVTGAQAAAHAVAGYGSGICKIPPLAICNPSETGSVKTFDPDGHIGKALILTSPPNSNNLVPGFYGFLTVNGSNSGNLIKEAMGRNPPLAECYGNTVETRFGNVASADDYFNTRFDIYAEAGTSGLKSAPEYAPAENTIIGVAENAGDCGPKNNKMPDPQNGCPISGTGPLGMPIDCGQSKTAAGFGPQPGQWAASSYLARNHSAGAGAGVNWSAYGPTGVGTSPTRFQVYNWELAQLRGVIPATFSSNQGATAGNNIDFARPQCNKASLPAGADRRTISAVVINCLGADAPKANSTSPVVAYIDLFLIAPAKDHTIFGEVIGTTTDVSAVGKETRKYSVRLYE